MVRQCSKCAGSGLQLNIEDTNVIPPVPTMNSLSIRCLRCDGKGWLADDG